MLVNKESKRTTVYIPGDLAEQLDLAASNGLIRSKNDLIVAGLRRMLAQLGRNADDIAFTGMATDDEYQREAREIAAGFESAHAESLAHTDRR